MNPQQQSQNQPSQQPPQSGDSDQQPQLVYVARPHEPFRQEMTPAVQEKHEASKRKYPDLNLSEGEFIISAVDRHPIGLIGIWVAVGAIIMALIALAVILTSVSSSSQVDTSTTMPSMAILAIPIILISLLALLFGFIATIVYNANRFYLTNESVIQHIQTSLFSKREQTVSLSNVEDASFSQNGIMPHLFNYGLIRLSTEGDETTYRFSYASSPKQQIATLNNAVEAFKNGRPVTGED